MRGGQRVARAVVIGALAAGIGLGLGGCGRKGALDAPPSASVSGNQPINAPPSLGEQPNPFSMAPPEAPPAAAPPGGQPAQKKTFILDPLLR